MRRSGLAALLWLGLAADANAEAQGDLSRAWDAQASGATYEAIALYSRAIRSGELSAQDVAAAHNNRAIAYKTIGRLEKSIEDYASAIERRPEDGDLYVNRAVALLARGSPELAVRDYNRALQLDPDDARARTNLGDLLQARGLLRRAIEVYDETLRRAPELAEAYAARGRAFGKLRRHERAIEDFNAAIELEPDLAAAYRGRGFSNSGMGRHELAVADYEISLRLEPEDALAYRGRGNAYRRLARYEDAIADYDKATGLAPDDAESYYNRSLAHKAQGAYAPAIADLSSAIRLRPDFGPAYRQRGTVRFYLGQHSDAARDFRRSLNLDGPEPYRILWLYLSRERAGFDAREELAALAERLASEDWPAPLIGLFRGETSPEEILASIGSADQRRQRELECETNFYVGQYHLLNGNISAATESFRRSVATRITTFVEFAGAKMELKRIATKFSAETGQDGDGAAAASRR